VEARLGETRVVTFLVENNRPHETKITFRARSWLDAFGRELPGDEIKFEPEDATLPPGEAVGVQAVINVSEPLEAGMAYFTEFILEGCQTKPISVGLWIQDSGWYDHYAVCDPCRHRRARFVEFCHDHHDYWCDCDRPWHWDPHRHWHDEELCTWQYLPHSVEHM